MATNLPINVVLSSSLPSNTRSTPQEFADLLVARMRLQSTQSFSLFSSGSTAPTSDTGPWAKDGKSWRFWDSGTGSYIPFVQELSGIPDGLITFNKLNGPSFAGTVTNAMLADDAKKTYQWRAAAPGAGQTIAVSGAIVDLTFPRTDAPPSRFDPDGVWDEVNSCFTAPVSGYYCFFGWFQFDNSTATAAGMQITVYLGDYVSSANLETIGGNANYASPPGDRWFLNFNGVSLIPANTKVKFVFLGDDGVNTGNVINTSNSHVGGYLIERT
jgi:hypothetical protein